MLFWPISCSNWWCDCHGRHFFRKEAEDDSLCAGTCVLWLDASERKRHCIPAWCKMMYVSKDIGNIASCPNIKARSQSQGNSWNTLDSLDIESFEVNVWDRHWGENGGFSECADRMIFDLSIVASGVADQKLASSIMEVLKGHWEVLRVDPKGTCAPAERVIGKHVNRPKWSISENSWISDRFASPFLFIPFPFLYPFLMFSPLLFWYVLVKFGGFWECHDSSRWVPSNRKDWFFADQRWIFCKVPCNICNVQILVVAWIYSGLVFMRCDYNRSRTGIGCGIADKGVGNCHKTWKLPRHDTRSIFCVLPPFWKIYHDHPWSMWNLENMIQLVSWLTGYSQPALVFPDFQTSLPGLSGCRNGICLHGPLLSWKLWCCDPGAHNTSMTGGFPTCSSP